MKKLLIVIHLLSQHSNRRHGAFGRSTETLAIMNSSLLFKNILLLGLFCELQRHCT